MKLPWRTARNLNRIGGRMKQMPEICRDRERVNILRNKKKKNDKILMLAKSKLDSVETLISQALNDMEISHEEFITILKEKHKYERMKYILESEKKKNLWVM